MTDVVECINRELAAPTPGVPQRILDILSSAAWEIESLRNGGDPRVMELLIERIDRERLALLTELLRGKSLADAAEVLKRLGERT